jgi:soluble lytic murein transglycosylase-like protein
MPQSCVKTTIFALLFSALLLPLSVRSEPLATLFSTTTSSKKHKKAEPVLTVPSEYRVYGRAKSLLSQKGEAGGIESIQHEILLSRMKSETRTLERDLEDLFFALELRKAAGLAKKKQWGPALESFHRGLNGLQPYKWIYYWGESASKGLSQLCRRDKKKRDERCLTLAKRVVDAFPKAAQETKILRDLPIPDTGTSNEPNGDRLYQGYSEKIEKDEVAFQEILEDYLLGRDSDFLRGAKEFIDEYPKSLLRFRTQFLMGEAHRRNHRELEARTHYQSVLEQIPLGYYGIVSSERLGVNLRDKVSKQPLEVDLSLINPNFFEQTTINRAKALFKQKSYEEVGIELDALSRVRNYNNHFMLYLMKFATVSDQNLVAFKLANEMFQRRFDRGLNAEYLDLLFPDRYLKEIQANALVSSLDPLLITSLIKQESGYKANVISASGALGLMQLMPFTAIDVKKDLWLADLKDPATNIMVGTRYLQSLMKTYDGNVPYSLAAYNAGPHRVAKWKKEIKPDWTMIEFIESIPYKETRDYVTSILRNRYWYQFRKGIPASKITEIKL